MKAFLLLITVALSACTPTIYLFPTGRSASPQPSASLANPAAEFCEQNAGQHVIQTGANGSQQGFCIFIDRSYCEAWSYFNSECQPGDQPDADRILTPNLTVTGATGL